MRLNNQIKYIANYKDNLEKKRQLEENYKLYFGLNGVSYDGVGGKPSMPSSPVERTAEYREKMCSDIRRLGKEIASAQKSMKLLSSEEIELINRIYIIGKENGTNFKVIAKILGISRSTLYRRINSIEAKIVDHG